MFSVIAWPLVLIVAFGDYASSTLTNVLIVSGVILSITNSMARFHERRNRAAGYEVPTLVPYGLFGFAAFTVAVVGSIVAFVT
jgi:hypothetical protein